MTDAVLVGLAAALFLGALYVALLVIGVVTAVGSALMQVHRSQAGAAERPETRAATETMDRAARRARLRAVK